MAAAKLSKKLSPAVVEAYKPEADPYRVWDTVVPQLHLRVQPSGIKSWNVQWSRTSSRSLGKWPGVTVDAARTRAKAALVETDTHGKPLAVIDADKPQPKTLREFIDGYYRPWTLAKHKSGEEAADRILSAFADYADKPLTEINDWIIEKWRMAQRKAGRADATTNRHLATLKGALARAREWGLEAGTLAKVKQAKVDNAVVRYLTDDEGKRLRDALAAREAERRASRERHNAWHEARNTAGHPQWPADGYTDHLMPAVLLSLNTGLRRGELTRAC